MECGIYRAGAYRVWVGKFEGKGPPGITRHRWQDNIKVDLKEIFGMGHLGWCLWSFGGVT